jgi:hypothetical protein
MASKVWRLIQPIIGRRTAVGVLEPLVVDCVSVLAGGYFFFQHFESQAVRQGAAGTPVSY